MANQLATQEQALPDKLLLIALNGRPIFPGIFAPIMLSDEQDLATVERAMADECVIGLVLQRDPQTESAQAGDLFRVGTAARIVKKVNLPDGGINVFFSTIKRFRIRRILSKKNPMLASVEYLDDINGDSVEVRAYSRAILSEMKEIAESNPLFSDEMRLNMVNIDNPCKIADFIASVLNLERDEQQKILETLDVRARMEAVLVFIKREQELLRIQNKIQADLNQKVEKNQREHFLREEMASIKKELGMETDAKSRDYESFKKKIDSFNFEGEIKETVYEELEKFSLMEPNSSEFIVSRNFLETVSSLPWNDALRADYDMARAQKILESEHYGMADVKKRIVEFLAVRKLKGDCKGAILLFAGPPGVGKTSVGRSIARAMQRPFYRFSVGGMHDEAEIRGHRRTYVGAMPGKIIQGLKIAKSKSPVFMIDEIDKMGASGYHGDPSSALLEVLDPEQNVAFRDNFLDLPFDVSNVLFILTANTLDSVPQPLLDRAEVIELSGYIDSEKIEIAKKYLVPKTLEKNGFSKGQISFSQSALKKIAAEYAREAGVRNFERTLDKIERKIAAEFWRDSGKNADELKLQKFKIGEGDLTKYLGKPVFDESEIKRADEAGSAIGLAWTSMGGDTLKIESSACETAEGKGGFSMTGQLGDVMKESAEISLRWVKKNLVSAKKISPKWFESHAIHLHIPEGATPKDGPSAGITMACAFYSLLTKKKMRSNLAMTGELSLLGQVLPIGGLKEKTVAAKRNKIRKIIIPKSNLRDLDDIPENVKSGIEFFPVTRMEEVIGMAF